MKATDIKLADLKTYSDCTKAIDAIEMDFRNVVGGSKAFFSGYATELTAGAKRKIEAIEKKMEKFEDYDE